jgi:hypothetical protein
MIEKTIGYKTGEKVFAFIEDAQREEIARLLNADPEHQMIDAMITHSKEIVDILTTGPKSRPKARAVNGAKWIRKPKIMVADTGTQATLTQ